MERSLSILIRAAVMGQTDEMSRLLASHPELATEQSAVGASRQNAAEFFFDKISHYLFAGDTALHMAAAAFQRPAAELLVRSGAVCHARNRRGAQPLHYAADANRWAPAAQRDTIEFLLSAGANPNAVDASGVTPLHRAVRTRSSEAVRALLAGGAHAGAKNGSGSTPLHLAVQNTGRGGSGSARAREEQARIVAILLEAGARATDKDNKGRTVLEASSKEWIATLRVTLKATRPE
jgi:ankyrin repeat protein